MAQYQLAPLPATFTVTSIIGLLVVTIYTAFGTIPLTWGFTLSLVFTIMLVASIVSITPQFPKEI